MKLQIDTSINVKPGTIHHSRHWYKNYFHKIVIVFPNGECQYG